jgi:hypothetical protein
MRLLYLLLRVICRAVTKLPGNWVTFIEGSLPGNVLLTEVLELPTFKQTLQ